MYTVAKAVIRMTQKHSGAHGIWSINQSSLMKYLEQAARKQYKNNQPKKGNILLNEERNCISQLNRLERLREQGFKYI